MNMEDAGGRTMFRKGEYVIYGNNGICCIEEIGVPRDTPLGDSGKEYYTLAPVFSSGKIYAPLGHALPTELRRIILETLILSGFPMPSAS